MDETSAFALAAAQGGIITRRQALDLGYTRGRIDHRVATGRWGLVARSAYRLLPATSELDVLRGAQTAMPAAIVSHGSAARILGLDRVPKGPPTLSVTDDHAHCFKGAVVRRSAAGFPASHRTRREGVVLTSAARTVVDLAGHVPEAPWDGIAQAAVVGQLCTVDDIRQVATRVCGRGRPGSTAVRRFLTDEAASLSALERKVADLLAPLRPVAQYPAPWNQRLRLDFAFPAARVAVEADSRRWHRTTERFEADRRRDREALVAGWVIVRVTWFDVTERPGEILRQVVELIDQRTPVPTPE